MGLGNLEWIRRTWPGKLVVKGIQDSDDARRVVGAGADAIVVSNHGGRQLDRSPATLDILPTIAGEVGTDVSVLLDGGVMDGADVVAARALGADAVMIGRAYLYGLMAAGQLGVERVLDLLERDVARTLRLLGAADISDIDHTFIRRPAQL